MSNHCFRNSNVLLTLCFFLLFCAYRDDIEFQRRWVLNCILLELYNLLAKRIYGRVKSELALALLQFCELYVKYSNNSVKSS